MPFKDPEQRRDYSRRWLAARRAAWFAGKVCELCGTSEDLQLDHIDPRQKVSHRIWSWAKEPREAELAKCRPLCRSCHRAKSNTEVARGERIGSAKLTEDDVREIRASALPSRHLGQIYGVDEKAIREVRLRNTWRHVA